MTPRQRTYGRGRVFRKKRRGVEYGCYLMAYYVGGEQVTESTKTTDLAVATRLLNERIAAVGARQAPQPGLYRVTMSELLDDLESHQEVECYPSLRTTRTHLVALRPAFGKTRAADLTTKHLEKFVTAQRQADYAEATIARQLDTLHRALTRGREVTPPKVATVPSFPKIDESGNVRQGFASREQVARLLEYLAERDPDLMDAVEWKAFTGMRKGAISRLGWDLFDHDTWTLRLPPPGRKKRTPKALPLLPGHPLRVIIERRWERRKDRARETGRLEPLIFWRIYQGHPRKGLRPGDAARVYEYRKAFAAAAKAAGLPGLTPHDLRRTAVRNAWWATRDRRICMLLAGHATESMHMRYNIDAGDELAPALERIAAYVAEGRPSVPTLPRRRTRGR
jgi:integrase